MVTLFRTIPMAVLFLLFFIILFYLFIQFYRGMPVN